MLSFFYIRTINKKLIRIYISKLDNVMQENKKIIFDRLNEPQVLLSLLYITAISIGMIFNYAKFKVFGINIFDYADLTDFILFPFSDLKVLVLTLVVAIICLLLFYLDLKLRDIFPNIFNQKIISKKQHKIGSILLSIVLFIAFIFIISEKYSKNFYANILLSDNITIYTKTQEFTGKYVGKTNDVIFIYQDKKLKIFPITSNIIYYKIN